MTVRYSASVAAFGLPAQLSDRCQSGWHWIAGTIPWTIMSGFTIEGINTGTATVVVSEIVTIPVWKWKLLKLVDLLSDCRCMASANGPPLAVWHWIFAVSNGNIFHHGGRNAGNQEAFTIVATATNNAIIGAPQTQFTTNVLRGCTLWIYCTQSNCTVWWKQYQLQLDNWLGTPIYRIRCWYRFYNFQCWSTQCITQCIVMTNGCVGSTRSVTVQQN